jgi:hypothetical protein
MGAKTLLSGMKPDIALTLETMGVELKGVRTTLNLEDALAALGVRAPEVDDGFSESELVSGNPLPTLEELAKAAEQGLAMPFLKGGGAR